jgi:hypothetical protein
MQNIELRIKAGVKSPNDLVVGVQDPTFEYLMTSPVDQIRVSTYLISDCEHVEKEYAELFVNSDCPFQTQIDRIIPGSKTRRKIELPGSMKEGEQLVVLVSRSAAESVDHD